MQEPREYSVGAGRVLDSCSVCRKVNELRLGNMAVAWFCGCLGISDSVSSALSVYSYSTLSSGNHTIMP